MEFIARGEIPLAFKVSLKFITILSIITSKELQHMKTMMPVLHNERMQLMSTTRREESRVATTFSPYACVFRRGENVQCFSTSG